MQLQIKFLWIQRFNNYDLSDVALNYLKDLSEVRACTYGAICVRNKYRETKIPPFDSAKELQKSEYITFYTDNDGNNITNPKKLYEILRIGDLLLYKPDLNFYLQNEGRQYTENELNYSGHTGIIIGKGHDDHGDFLDLLEFHMQEVNEPWNEATVKRVYSDTLRTFSDCELMGGAAWK